MSEMFNVSSEFTPKIGLESSLKEDRFKGIDSFDILGLTTRNNSMVGLAYTQATDLANDFEEDETFTQKDKLKYINSNFPSMREDYKIKLIEDGVSLDAMQTLAPERFKESETANLLDSKGFIKGMLYEMAGALPDIALVYAGAAVSPMVAKTLTATRMRATAIGMTTETALQLAQNEYGHRDLSPLEMVLSVGTVGAFTHMLSPKINTQALSQLSKNEMENALGITDVVKNNVANAKSDKEVSSIISNAIKTSDFINTKRVTSENKTKLIANYYKKLSQQKQEGRMSKGVFDSIRTDTEFMFKNSPIKEMQLLGDSLFIDGTLGNINKDATTLLEMQTLFEDSALGQISIDFTPIQRTVSSELKKQSQFKKLKPSFLDSESLKVVSEVSHFASFARNTKMYNDDELLLRARKMLVDRGISEESSKGIATSIIAASKKTSKGHGERNIEFGNKHFGNDAESAQYEDVITPDEDYYTTIYSFDGVRDLTERGFSTQDIEDWAFNAISKPIKKSIEKYNKSIEGKVKKDGNPYKQRKPLDEEKMKKVAKSFIEIIGKTSMKDSSRSSSNTALFKTAFELAGFSEREAKSLLGLIDENTGSVFEKSRIPMDRSYIHKVDGVGKISLYDFTNKDYFANNMQYTKKQSGRTALQKFRFAFDGFIKDLVVNNDKDRLEVLGLDKYVSKDENGNTIIDTVDLKDLGTDEGAEMYREIIKHKAKKMFDKGKITQSEITAELARYDHMINYFHGKPTAVDIDNPAHKWVQIGKNMNVHRLLGATPVAMVAELHNIARYTGFFNTMKNLPQFLDAVNFIRKGEFKNPRTRELVEDIGIGADFVQGIKSSLNDHDFKTTDFGMKQDIKESISDKALGVSEQMAEFTMMLGGMKPMNIMMQIAISTGYTKAIQRISQGVGSKVDKLLMKESGLSESMAKLISENIEKHKVLDSRGNIKSIGLKNWDYEARLQFKISNSRITHNVVQKSNYGTSLAYTMGNSLFNSTFYGKMVMDLKSYMYSSYVNQFLKMTHSKDSFHYMNMISQLALMSQVYVGEQYVKYGDDEAKLKKRLSLENIAIGAVGRSTSLSAPNAFAGLGSIAITGQNHFSSGRMSHSSAVTSAIEQIPTLDFANQVLNIIPSLTSMMTPDGDSKDISKTIRKLTFNGIINQAIYNRIEETQK